MRKRKDLEGLAVVDVSGGRKLGAVSDFVISPSDGRVLAITLRGGLFGGGGSYVAAGDVRSIGPDALTVEGDQVVRPESEMPDDLREARDASKSLAGKKVVTENGTLLGTVSDYLVDESALRVTGLTIGGGLLSGEDALAADRVVSVGPDALIVTDPEGEHRDAAAADRRSPWSGG
jgi:uncharacterized protein YrrD